MNQYGYREIATTALLSALSQSPTGLQLSIDGSFILPLYTTNPANSIITPPDGTTVLWSDSGTLRIRAFTRATGWQTI